MTAAAREATRARNRARLTHDVDQEPRGLKTSGFLLLIPARHASRLHSGTQTFPAASVLSQRAFSAVQSASVVHDLRQLPARPGGCCVKTVPPSPCTFGKPAEHVNPVGHALVAP